MLGRTERMSLVSPAVHAESENSREMIPWPRGNRLGRQGAKQEDGPMRKIPHATNAATVSSSAISRSTRMPVEVSDVTD